MIATLVGLLEQQVRALRELPETLVSVNRGAQALAEFVRDAQDTTKRANLLLQRVDSLLDELEPGLRALGPGLLNVAEVAGSESFRRLPKLVEQFEADAVPALGAIGSLSRQVASIETSVAKLAALVDDVGERLGGIPGFGRITRGRRARPDSVLDPILGSDPL